MDCELLMYYVGVFGFVGVGCVWCFVGGFFRFGFVLSVVVEFVWVWVGLVVVVGGLVCFCRGDFRLFCVFCVCCFC